MISWPTRPGGWQLVFVLPNLQMSPRKDRPQALTLGLQGIAIVPLGDPRVTAIREWSEPADRFLGSFHDGYGGPIEPAALLVRDDWLAAFRRSAEPIVAFRNAVALSCILPARGSGKWGAWAGTSWSDTFDFHPAQLRPDGSAFDVITPALNQAGMRLNELSLTRDVGMPSVELLLQDEHIAVRLGRAWKRRYLQRRDRVATARVFRSLEAAYQATSVGFKNYASLNEVGMDAVFWANAVEILAQRNHANVTKWDGADLVGEFFWEFEPRLRDRKYRYQVRKARPGRSRKVRGVNLAQKIYLLLYDTRSRFVHGDKVSDRLLLPFGGDAPSLLSLSSTVYRLGLHAYLERHWPVALSLSDFGTLDLLAGTTYESHLLSALR